MKITRNKLKALITEEIRKSRSMLLEMPSLEGAYSYRNDDEDSGSEGDPIDLTGQKLYHMARQADQLHDMLKGDEKLVDKIRGDIIDISDKLREIFEAVTHDKNNPEGI